MKKNPSDFPPGIKVRYVGRFHAPSSPYDNLCVTREVGLVVEPNATQAQISGKVWVHFPSFQPDVEKYAQENNLPWMTAGAFEPNNLERVIEN
ncbi:hypothetical protein [Deinococcus misasensis]|uniref:hypothetical protein n=1 Tax=Deinococcus misasensis TaxID=392413 RepID=UPI0005577F73|nr:hypothetical protein [Deinococcus misasensis]